MVTTKISQSYFRCVKLFIHNISCSYNGNIRDWLLLNCAFIISDVIQSYCSSVFAKLLKKQRLKIVQISIFKVEYFENGSADFNDFGLILQDFERPFR